MADSSLYNQPEKKNKRVGLRYFVALLAGVVIGAGATVGSAFFVATKVPTSQVVSLFGEDPNKILTDKYQKESLYQFILSLTNGEIDFTTAGGISKLTPFVGEIVDQFRDYLKTNLGIEISREEIYAMKIEELPTLIVSQVKNESLVSTIIQADEDSVPFLKLISFKKDENGNYDYSKRYTINELSEGITEIVSNAEVQELVEVKEGNSLYPFRKTQIKNLDDKFKHTPLNELVDLGDEQSKILQTIGSWTFSNIFEKVQNLEVGDIVDDDSNSIINYLVNNHIKLTELSFGIANMPLNCLVSSDNLPFALQSVLFKVKGYDENGNPLYYTIDEMADCYRALSVGDIYDYSSSLIKDNRIFKWIDADTKLDDLADAFNNITLGKAFSDDIYETIQNPDGSVTKKMIPMWEFLLHNPDTDKDLHDATATEEEKFSGLSLRLQDDFNVLTQNIAKNTKVSTLFSLYDHGVLIVKDPSILNKKIIGDTSGKCIGDYTYTDFIDFLANSGLLVD